MRTGFRITQGTFSYLPDLTDDEIRAQIQYGVDNGWAPSVEFTDDPHPRNVYWEMWGMPMFDLKDAAAAFYEVNRCREAFPNFYIRVTLYNSSFWSTGLSTSPVSGSSGRRPAIASCVTRSTRTRQTSHQASGTNDANPALSGSGCARAPDRRRASRRSIS
jgi:ribulose-bisphosphate carboxylase small chain